MLGDINIDSKLGHLLQAVFVFGVGVYFVWRTKLGTLRTDNTGEGLAFAIRLFVKGGAWIFALIGALALVRSLFAMLA